MNRSEGQKQGGMAFALLSVIVMRRPARPRAVAEAPQPPEDRLAYIRLPRLSLVSATLISLFISASRAGMNMPTRK